MFATTPTNRSNMANVSKPPEDPFTQHLYTELHKLPIQRL